MKNSKYTKRHIPPIKKFIGSLKSIMTTLRRSLGLVLLSVLIFSCGYKANKNASVRDSFASEYFKRMDSISYSDTSNLNYKLFKAYYLNDTVFLKTYQREIVDKQKWDSSWSQKDSCVRQQPLTALNAIEAYRFIYSSAFCEHKLIMTVTNSRDLIMLNVLLYKFAWEGKDCHVVSEQNIKLSGTQWSKFKQAIDYSDFWGLMPDNGFSGNDGDNLDVFGYEKNTIEIKTHMVHRWGTWRTSLRRPFLQLFKYSNLKQVCFLNLFLLEQQHSE
ncbi:MAG: hypothetical protein JSS96_11265 [Bacteroidetes bacterium]|nr:hypothetical protein [Bacteroidota bacterium]